MRTTLDIDTDVLLAVKERARKERKSAGRLISNMLRSHITGGGGGEPTRDDDCIFEYKNGIPVLRSRGDIITAEHVRKLMEEEDI